MVHKIYIYIKILSVDTTGNTFVVDKKLNSVCLTYARAKTRIAELRSQGHEVQIKAIRR